MSFKFHRDKLSPLNIWPGFVDALTALVMVLVFVVLVFVISQYILGVELSGRNRAVDELNQEMNRLSALLMKAKQDKDQLLAQKTQLSDQVVTHAQTIDSLQSQNTALSAKVENLSAEKTSATQEKVSLEERMAHLQNQIQELMAQLKLKAIALDHHKSSNQALEEEVASLTKELENALNSEAIKLANYKSEFFGRLKEALANQTDMIVVGDRFMFQSEVLFDSASAELEDNGKEQLKILAKTLKKISKSIPADLNWILRVDGHTDKRPIHTAKFNSNWELSAARAISVVYFLTQQGIPSKRLVAAGFGEFQPLSSADQEGDYNRNRRIELRIDQR
jgi:chemotaxis protein MotB